MSTKNPPRRASALDLGVLQSDMEQAARSLKSTTSALLRASEANVQAENAYDVARKALAAGVAQLTAATKVA